MRNAADVDDHQSAILDSIVAKTRHRPRALVRCHCAGRLLLGYRIRNVLPSHPTHRCEQGIHGHLLDPIVRRHLGVDRPTRTPDAQHGHRVCNDPLERLHQPADVVFQLQADF